jgi:chromate reductase
MSARLRDAITSADAVLFSTPEYNGTMPGQMKQVVDWGSRPHGAQSALWGKPVAVIGASVTDYGAIWAQGHLRKSLGLAGARVLGDELAVAKAQEHFDADGELSDVSTRGRLAEVLNALVAQLTTAA